MGKKQRNDGRHRKPENSAEEEREDEERSRSSSGTQFPEVLTAAQAWLLQVIRRRESLPEALERAIENKPQFKPRPGDRDCPRCGVLNSADEGPRCYCCGTLL